MQSRIEFLRSVLPQEGVYVAVAIDDGHTRQTFHNSIEELDGQLNVLHQSQVNTFFALASFNTRGTRTTDNIKHLQSFYVDLDCGIDPDGRKYETQAEALAALKEFVKDLKFPKPTIVNSGRGIHAYWPLTEPVSRLEWKAVAEKLKATCQMKGFKADPAVTADAARILRAPFTTHVKDKDNPLPVDVLRVGEATPFEVFRKILGVTDFEVSTAQIAKRPMDEVTKNLLGNRPSWFKEILKKCTAGEGCNQLLYAATHQDTIEEPMWRAALSVAAHCADGDKAIHLISNQHPDYSPEATVKKASSTKGPYTCGSFQSIDATLCEGCPHVGKISSPIVLGMGKVLEAEPEDNEVVVEAEKYEIPTYPFPYFRGKHGGVYGRFKEKNEDGDAVTAEVLIYEYDFYLVSIINDPHEGMSALFRAHLPRDGVREFCMPCRDVLTKEKFRDWIANEGVFPVNKSQMDGLMTYATTWVKAYQKESSAKKGRVQFGWADNYECFIVGDREIRHDEIVYSPPSASTVQTAPKFRKRGDLKAWQSVADFYTRPGQEVAFFALMAGFAAPLMSVLGVQGGIICLHSPEGGTGKSTTLHMINSIFGHPKEAMLIANDTSNSRIHRLGVLNNIAATIDEITNETPESLSNTIFAMLQGRGKERMQGSHNTERKNTTTWNTVSVVTGNSVVSEKLYLLKKCPDGELRRILEFPFPKPTGLSKTSTDELFRPLYENYGVAGEVYVQYLLNNFDRIRELFFKVQRKADVAAGLSQREQVWSDTVTGAIVASIFVRDSGVIPMSDDRLRAFYQWCVEWLKVNKDKAEISYVDPEETLGAFLSEHVNDMLIINSVSKHAGVPDAPIREPKGRLLIRYEPDTKELCVSSSKLRDYCTKQQISFNQMIKGLEEMGRYKGTIRKRLGKGTAISVNERVVVLHDMDKDFVLGGKHAGDARNTGSS